MKTNDTVDRRFFELLKSSNTPLSVEDRENIIKAFDFAKNLHSDNYLPDGSPYILHNLNVAITAMREIGLGPTSAICSLLHGEKIKNRRTH